MFFKSERQPPGSPIAVYLLAQFLLAALVVSWLLGIALWGLVVSVKGELCVVVQLHIAEVILCDDLVAQCADVDKGGFCVVFGVGAGEEEVGV